MHIAAVNIKESERPRYMNDNNYAIIHNKIWDIAVKEDNRSADNIIQDTFEQHGIKIIGGSE